MLSLWLLGVLLYLACIVGLAFICGTNDHPPARGLFQRRSSPNPFSRL